MRYWLSLHYEPWDQLLPLAQAAEELGYEGVVLPDHVVIPEETATIHPTGYPLPPDVPYLDALMCFAAMASVTTRLRFLTDILIVPLRDPFVLAKQLSTLALLSGNRVVLGTGTGWFKDEFEIIGRGWHDRGKRLDEDLDIMRDFWLDGWAQKQGEHYKLPRSGMFPVPSEPIPIWVGGHSRVAARRAARFDGYMPMRSVDEVTRAEFAEIDQRRADAGLTGPFERVTYWPGGDRSTAKELEERDGVGSAIVVAWDQFSAMGRARKQAEAGGTLPPYVSPPLAQKLAGAEAFATQIIRG